MAPPCQIKNPAASVDETDTAGTVRHKKWGPGRSGKTKRVHARTARPARTVSAGRLVTTDSGGGSMPRRLRQSQAYIQFASGSALWRTCRPIAASHEPGRSITSLNAVIKTVQTSCRTTSGLRRERDAEAATASRISINKPASAWVTSHPQPPARPVSSEPHSPGFPSARPRSGRQEPSGFGSKRMRVVFSYPILALQDSGSQVGPEPSRASRLTNESARSGRSLAVDFAMLAFVLVLFHGSVTP